MLEIMVADMINLLVYFIEPTVIFSKDRNTLPCEGNVEI